MHSSLIRTSGLAILYVCASAGAAELTPMEEAARDYSFHGVSIGTTKQQFMKQFPHARPHGSDRPNVTAMYATVGKQDRFIIVEFFRGKIYYLGVTFTAQNLARLGGRSVLEAKLTDTLGYPNSVKRNMSYWKFPNVNRMVGYQQLMDGSSTLLILDTAVDQQRRDAQISELDIGF